MAGKANQQPRAEEGRFETGPAQQEHDLYMDIPRDIALEVRGPFSLSECHHKERSACWRVMSSPAVMRKFGRIEVNGKFVLQEMPWHIELYESKNPDYANEVGLDFAQVWYRKDAFGEPTALLIAHLRGLSFQRLRNDLLNTPSLCISLSFPVLGVIYDSERDIDRWLTSKADRLEVTDLTVSMQLAGPESRLPPSEKSQRVL